jgi:hypothetical protein
MMRRAQDDGMTIHGEPDDFTFIGQVPESTIITTVLGLAHAIDLVAQEVGAMGDDNSGDGLTHLAQEVRSIAQGMQAERYLGLDGPARPAN